MKLLRKKTSDKELVIKADDEGVKIEITDDYGQQKGFSLTIDESRKLRDRLKRLIEFFDREEMTEKESPEPAKPPVKTYSINSDEKTKTEGFKLFNDEKSDEKESEFYY
ncbi:hypothetical protein GF352_00785 [archaeon]|nr:hypothetical protein [archaeon]